MHPICHFTSPGHLITIKNKVLYVLTDLFRLFATWAEVGEGREIPTQVGFQYLSR
jgi:hypothetical protein